MIYVITNDFTLETFKSKKDFIHAYGEKAPTPEGVVPKYKFKGGYLYVWTNGQQTKLDIGRKTTLSEQTHFLFEEAAKFVQIATESKKELIKELKALYENNEEMKEICESIIENL